MRTFSALAAALSACCKSLRTCCRLDSSAFASFAIIFSSCLASALMAVVILIRVKVVRG